jgi:hypothetical protein
MPAYDWGTLQPAICGQFAAAGALAVEREGGLDRVAAVPGGLSATRSGHARHRAQRSPVLTPSAPSRRAHLRRRWGAGLSVALLLVLIAAIAGWRLVEAQSNTDLESPGTPSGSPSARTMVSIGDSGAVHVVMSFFFEAPRREVTLQVPRRDGAAVVFHPSVEILSLEAGERPQVLHQTLGVGEAVSVPLDHAVDRVRVEYAATGTYVASKLSTPGRGLVLLTPLTVLESDIPFLLGLTDARVLNLGCVDSAQMRACGSRSGDSWTADRVATEEDVVAQVDLVRPDS